MTGIFINYRRKDASAFANRLYMVLKGPFGGKRVFYDSAELEPGRPFHPELERRLRASTVVLALIGPHWLTEADSNGTRLIDRPDDYVRWEIEVSLQRQIHVIPVRLDGTALPAADSLPDSLKVIPVLQYLDLRARNFDDDVAAIERACANLVPMRKKARKKAAGGSGGINGDVKANHSAVAIGNGADARNSVNRLPAKDV
jgi:hypothetical protein